MSDDELITKEEIKRQAEMQYEAIRKAEKWLEKLREICKHEETFVGNWSWRVDKVSPAHICSHCGKFIKYISL